MSGNKQRAGISRELKTLSILGHKMTKQGRYREAEEKYHQALTIDSKNVYALVGLGDLKRKTRRFEDAVSYYQKALEAEKDNKYALAGLGDAFRGLRKIDKALEQWMHYLSLSPNDYKVITRVADGFRRKGDLKESKKYYLKAVKKKADDSYALMGLGDICLKEGNDEEALKFFEKLINISASIPADSIMALTSAAKIYRRHREYERAMDCYNQVLEIDPQNSYAWHGKADCFRGLRQHSYAIKGWQMAIKYGMDPRIALTRIGNAYMSLKEFDEAETHYKKALAIGYDKYAHLGMTRIHAIKDQMDKALEIFSMLLEKEPNDSRVNTELNRFVERYPEVKDSVIPPEIDTVPRA